MSAKEVREEIFYPACAPEIKPAEVEPARPGSRPPSGLSPCTKDLVSELVILPTLGRITQDLIRLSDLLELRLGRLVVGVDVGVMLSGQVARLAAADRRRRAALRSPGDRSLRRWSRRAR